MKNMTKARIAIAGSIIAIAAAAAPACGVKDDYDDKHGQGDAPVDDTNDSARDVMNFPNGFSNVAHGCDGFGHRVFVTTQNASGKELVVVDDPSCSG